MPKNVKCKVCLNLNKNHWCEKKLDSPDEDMIRDCQYFCQKTNADVIRAMTDEELAKLICKHKPMYSWPEGVRQIYFSTRMTGIEAWTHWLQQPVKEKK